MFPEKPVIVASPENWGVIWRLERNDFSSNRHPTLIFLFEHDLRANAFRVCREGKPVPTFPDHALARIARARRLALDDLFDQVDQHPLRVVVLQPAEDPQQAQFKQGMQRLAV
jgi:hypothetical protein